VVNAASGEARLAPGAIATVFGARLSSGEQQATRLLLPTQMGETFKAIALGRDYPETKAGASLAAFSVQDFRDRL
jgi:uncharacterized protein (TIGR03437 family)